MAKNSKSVSKSTRHESSESSTTDVSGNEEDRKKCNHKHKHTAGGSCCGGGSSKGVEAETLVARMAEALRRSKETPSADAKEAIVPTNARALAYLCENNIMKRTLHQGSVERMPAECKGSGGGIVYPPQTKFIFNYRIRDPSEPEVFLDDTKKYGKEMELYSGKDFQIEFWEYCLQTMTVDEVASFTVPPSRLISFPAVNKKLRDYMLNKNGPGTPGGVPQHSCAFMSLKEQGGLGYADLDDLIVNPKILEFIFELVRVILPSQVRKETWIMTPEEKAATVPLLRKEGNDLYSAGRWFEAAAKYEEGLNLLEQLALGEKPGDEEFVQFNQSRVPFFLNMAQCQFKLKDYYGAIRSTTEALSRDGDNTKALYRRAMSYSAISDVDLAQKDFERVLVVAPTMAKTINRELENLNNIRRACKEEERRRLAGKIFTKHDTHVS